MHLGALASSNDVSASRRLVSRLITEDSYSHFGGTNDSNQIDRFSQKKKEKKGDVTFPIPPLQSKLLSSFWKFF